MSTVEARLEELRNEDARVRRNAARELARLADSQAVEALAQAIDDPDEEVATSAAWALGEIDDPRVTEILDATVRDLARDEFVRREAVLGLANRGRVDVIEDVLKDERQGWVVRSEAAGTLAELGERTAKPILRELLEHAHEKVREAAAEALAVLGSKDDLQALTLAFVNDNDKRVAKAADRAIKEIEKRLG
jgi:HEAT repeat protein